MESIEIQIKNNAPQAANEFKSLREQVREAKNALKELEVGSDEYNSAIQRLANVTHEYREEQEVIKNSAGDLGTVFSNLQSVASGVAAGFSSINAIATLTGANTEGLQQTMVRLQAAMALVQGLKGMEGMGKKMRALITSTKAMTAQEKSATVATTGLGAAEVVTGTATKGLSAAMQGLKAALISTGIGAIIVLLGVAANALMNLIQKTSDAKAENNEFANVNDKLNSKFEEQNQKLDREVRLLEASGATTQEVIRKKQELVNAQIAETRATLAGIEARKKQIEADSWWYRFWHSENKELKKLKEESEALQETLDSLVDTAADLAVDLEVANTKAANDAAKKAADVAKAAAEKRKQELAKASQDFKSFCDKMVADYKAAMNDINNIRNSLTGSISDTNKIKEVTDVEAWIQVFGTDPKNLDTKLSGVANELGRNLRNGLYNAFTENIKGKDAETIKALTKDYYDILVDAGLEKAEDLSILVGDLALVPAMKAADTIESVASGISEEFTNKFNSLNKLYDEGIVDYKEYYDTLLNIQDEYQVAVAGFRNMYVDEEKMSAERVAQLEYAMQIKPLATQKEVSEKFMNQLDADIAAIEGMFNASNTESYNRYWDAVYGNYKDKKTGAMADRDQWKVSVREMRDLSIQYANETYEAENKRIEQERFKIQEQLANNELTVEAKQELNDQLAQLNADQETNEQQHVETMTAIQDEFLASIEAQVTGMVDAFSGLSDSFANIAGAMVDRYEWMYENEEMTEEEYKKKKKQALKAQAAFNIASAIMDTGAGITKVWMHAADLGPIAGPIAAGVQTAAYLANLASQIISINTGLKKGLTEDNSGTSGGSSGVDASATVLNSDSYANILSDTTNTDLQKNAQDNVKVFVLESDISDRQNSTRTTVSTSTF